MDHLKLFSMTKARSLKVQLRSFVKKLRINVVKGRPYHPQSQGKVERTHRSFRKKLMYDLLTMKNGGANWVKSLPKYAKTLNEEPREELLWKSPFEVYYGRKVNRFDRLVELPVAQEWDQTLEEYERMVAPKPRDYTRHTNDSKKISRKRWQSFGYNYALCPSVLGHTLVDIYPSVQLAAMLGHTSRRSSATKHGQESPGFAV
ncbi:hypothetical protein ACROYT_G015657 [Oculina patagonica]